MMESVQGTSTLHLRLLTEELLAFAIKAIVAATGC